MSSDRNPFRPAHVETALSAALLLLPFDAAVFEQEFRGVLEQAWSAWCRDPSSVEKAQAPACGLVAPAGELLA